METLEVFAYYFSASHQSVVWFLKRKKRGSFTFCIFNLNGELFFAGVFVEETDVAKFTICTIDDPRTLNNTLYLRPLGNVYSMNKLVDLWEKKINKFLNKIYITEEQLLKNIEGK